MESPLDTVTQRVGETARRLRLRRGWETAWTGSTWGLALLIAGVGIHKFLPLSQPILVGIASLPGIGAGVGCWLIGLTVRLKERSKTLTPLLAVPPSSWTRTVMAVVPLAPAGASPNTSRPVDWGVW